MRQQPVNAARDLVVAIDQGDLSVYLLSVGESVPEAMTKPLESTPLPSDPEEVTAGSIVVRHWHLVRRRFRRWRMFHSSTHRATKMKTRIGSRQPTPLNMARPSLRSMPCRDKGIPMLLDNLCLAAVKPIARFHENDKPGPSRIVPTLLSRRPRIEQKGLYRQRLRFPRSGRGPDLFGLPAYEPQPIVQD